MKKKNFFLKLSIPLALLYWIAESAIHYLSYGESVFEIIPSDRNELWMRTSFFILLPFFALFADFVSRNRIAKSEIKNLSENISRAKKQWQLVVDSLPQLAIAMDHNARITRVNRTVETWGMGKVNKVNGLYVPDFLKCLNDDFSNDAWTSDWPYIWQQIKNRDTIVRRIEKEHGGKIYQYSLRKTADYDASKDQCYAVLIVDDITARSMLERSLKEQTQLLEKTVYSRTIELQRTNNQLEHELYANKEANIELKKSQECRLELLRELFVAQETERKRIAGELHDSIGQSLGAAKFKIEELLMNKKNFIDDSEYDQFNELVKTIKNAVQEVRNIAMDLRPAMLDDLGALPTLNWFCREYSNTYTGITVDALLNIEESDISEDKKVVIFRIVQEAMNNIAKHAKATNIVLDLNKTSCGITISITDNGCGFDTDIKPGCNPNDVKCSFGLSSMRERAESTNGKFTMKSTLGGGTSVIVSWENEEYLSLDNKMTA